MSTTRRKLVYYQSKKTQEYLASVIDGCLLCSEKISDALLLYEQEALKLKKEVLLQDTVDVWLHREIKVKRCQLRAKSRRRIKYT